MKIEIEREEDGRWIAEIPELPGVMVYGATRNQAIAKAEALALRVMADRLEHDEEIPELKEVFACQHEPVAVKKGAACPRSLAPHRLDN